MSHCSHPGLWIVLWWSDVCEWVVKLMICWWWIVTCCCCRLRLRVRICVLHLLSVESTHCFVECIIKPLRPLFFRLRFRWHRYSRVYTQLEACLTVVYWLAYPILSVTKVAQNAPAFTPIAKWCSLVVTIAMSWYSATCFALQNGMKLAVAEASSESSAINARMLKRCGMRSIECLLFCLS